MNGSSLRRQLPHGLTDLFFEQAAAKVALERILEHTFESWGYRRIILPTFEYYDSLSTGASTDLQEEMYRFFDREGKTLALRPDMTVPTARVVGTKLYDQPLPLRFFYIGNVFRYEEPQAGRRREFTQAGIELLGSGTPEADAEVLSVAIAALKALGIHRFRTNLGQVAFLKAILKEANLSNGELSQLEQAIGHKNDTEVDHTLKKLRLTEEISHAVRAIPHLCGGIEVLEEAKKLSQNPAALQALDHLAQVYALLEAEGVAEHVIIDLGEVRSMAYYTGITFHAYVEGLGFHVCRGGRYDGLVGYFGRDMPAVGFALGVERAMLITKPQIRLAPDIIMKACRHPACHALAAKARSLGLSVEIEVLGRQGEELIAYGQAKGATRILACDENSPTNYLLTDAQGSRWLSRQQLEEEMASWTS